VASMSLFATPATSRRNSEEAGSRLTRAWSAPWKVSTEWKWRRVPWKVTPSLSTRKARRSRPAAFLRQESIDNLVGAIEAVDDGHIQHHLIGETLEDAGVVASTRAFTNALRGEDVRPGTYLMRQEMSGEAASRAQPAPGAAPF
jgi:hypothetical protein